MRIRPAPSHASAATARILQQARPAPATAHATAAPRPTPAPPRPTSLASQTPRRDAVAALSLQWIKDHRGQ